MGPYTAGLPPMNITGLTNAGVTQYKPQTQISQVWQLIDNFSWLKGNHSFKFGYEFAIPATTSWTFALPRVRCWWVEPPACRASVCPTSCWATSIKSI